MKVLHIYAGNLYGGVERVLVTLARYRHLAPKMEPEFALCFRGRLWDELSAAGVSIHDLGPVRVSRPWTVLRARSRLRVIIAQKHFSSVVTHACWPHALFAATVHRAGVQLATWVHDVLIGRNWIEHWAGRTLPDVAIANSQFTAASVPNVFPGVRTEVVYLPVAADMPADAATGRNAVRDELGTPESDVVILQACRLERWKGHAVLIEALGRLRNRPGWTAWIAGGPQKAGEANYLTELNQRAGELGIAGRVRFLGQRSDVSRLMLAADVMCQPNTGPEPFGIVFVEALYAGRPVVTSAIGGAAEVIDASCGFLTPPGDSAAVADALAELIDNPLRRATLGAAGPERAKRLCDPSHRLQAVDRVLREGIANNGG
jgi:glycosyltransferase involved in cell wall biosynthesis